MNKPFDLDYLGKDLTGNAEIQAAVDRGLAFMKLEKWEKSLQAFDDLIDLHPESPCGWFGKARLSSLNFTFFGLGIEERRPIIASAADNLEAAIKIVDDERKSEYLRLQATYSEGLKNELVNTYIEKFGGLVDSLQKAADLAKLAHPNDCSQSDYMMYVVCEAFNEILTSEDETIYNIPVEILKETGNEYPSLLLAGLHIILVNDIMKSYYEAERSRNKVIETREYRYEIRKKWLIKQGFNFDSSDKAEIDQKIPLYHLPHYFKYSVSGGVSFAKLLKENPVFPDAAKWDEKVKEVFGIYFKFLKLVRIPIGDLSDAGIPSIYLKEIEGELQKQAEAEKVRQEEQRKEEHERYVQQEKQKEIAAAQKAEQKSKKWKLVIVCFLFGGFGIHNFMMGETKKGVIKILLCWTGISAIIALVDLVKLLTDSYEISK